LRSLLKNTLPRPVTRALAGTENYGRRMASWLRVLRDVRGLTPADAAILRCSAVRAPWDALSELGQWREPQLVEDAEIDVRGLGRFAVRGKSDDLGQVLPATHALLFSTITGCLSPGDIAIDAGANIGAVSVFMAKAVTPTGRVIAVEMMPDTAIRLRHNLALSGLDWVEVVENALSDRAGETVVAEVVDGLFGQASIAPGSNPGRQVRRAEVKTTTLDGVTAGMKRIAVLKLDLEGAEPLALAGAGETLKRTGAVVFESWSGVASDAAGLLVDAGFAVSNIDGRNFLALRT